MHYFYDHIGKEDENLGSVKECVTSIDVSSCSVSLHSDLKLDLWLHGTSVHFNEANIAHTHALHIHIYKTYLLNIFF